jgi:hypothetical protein
MSISRNENPGASSANHTNGRWCCSVANAADGSTRRTKANARVRCIACIHAHVMADVHDAAGFHIYVISTKMVVMMHALRGRTSCQTNVLHFAG